MQAVDVYIHMSVELRTSVSCVSHSRGTTNYAGAIFLTSREENRHHGILVSERKNCGSRSVAIRISETSGFLSA